MKSRRNSKADLISLKDKIEILRINLEETRKYELLTTNQYLKHIELMVSILEDLSESTNNEQEPHGR